MQRTHSETERENPPQKACTLLKCFVPICCRFVQHVLFVFLQEKLQVDASCAVLDLHFTDLHLIYRRGMKDIMSLHKLITHTACCLTTHGADVSQCVIPFLAMTF